jgi:hypothetical protein
MIRSSTTPPTLSQRWLMPLAAVAALLTSGSASADLIVSAQVVSAPVGSTGNTLEVDLANTGGAAVNLAGFSFGLSVTDADISFTNVDINTTLLAYIFAGHSLFGPDISTTPPPSGQVVIASDNYDVANSGIVLASGATVGLGRVLFDVSSSASPTTALVTVTSFPTTSLSDFQGNDVRITTFQNGSITISPVPEPSTLYLTALGGVALLGIARRRRRDRAN